MEKAPLANLTHPIISVFMHIQTRQPLISANLEPYKMPTRDAELYKLKVKSEKSKVQN